MPGFRLTAFSHPFFPLQINLYWFLTVIWNTKILSVWFPVVASPSENRIVLNWLSGRLVWWWKLPAWTGSNNLKQATYCEMGKVDGWASSQHPPAALLKLCELYLTRLGVISVPVPKAATPTRGRPYWIRCLDSIYLVPNFDGIYCFYGYGIRKDFRLKAPTRS